MVWVVEIQKGFFWAEQSSASSPPSFLPWSILPFPMDWGGPAGGAEGRLRKIRAPQCSFSSMGSYVDPVCIQVYTILPVKGTAFSRGSLLRPSGSREGGGSFSLW